MNRRRLNLRMQALYRRFDEAVFDDDMMRAAAVVLDELRLMRDEAADILNDSDRGDDEERGAMHAEMRTLAIKLAHIVEQAEAMLAEIEQDEAWLANDAEPER